MIRPLAKSCALPFAGEMSADMKGPGSCRGFLFSPNRAHCGLVDYRVIVLRLRLLSAAVYAPLFAVEPPAPSASAKGRKHGSDKEAADCHREDRPAQ